MSTIKQPAGGNGGRRINHESQRKIQKTDRSIYSCWEDVMLVRLLTSRFTRGILPMLKMARWQAIPVNT